MIAQQTFTKAPLLRLVGEKHFIRFKNELSTYRAAGGQAALFSLIRTDTLSIYRDIADAKLEAPGERAKEVIAEEEKLFLEKLHEHYGNKSALDTFYSIEAIKLKEITEDAVAKYVTRYKASLRRLSEEEVLTDKSLTEAFIKGIKHPRFRLRVKAALEGESFGMSGLTKVIFQQLHLVLETLED
ncbi:hypothetical protein ADUPG1_007254, partial [Aduncisulcus paluster]